MFKKPSLVTRVAVGKILGLLVGFAGFIIFPYYMPDAGWMLRFGVLFWYLTFGAIIGMFGVFDWHPILKISLPWWIRGIFLGAWLNFVLVLISYDVLAAVMLAYSGPDGLLLSPFWCVAEGAVIGLFIDYFATRYGGEGSETVSADSTE